MNQFCFLKRKPLLRLWMSFILFFLSTPLIFAQSKVHKKEVPVSIIFDTDMGPDYDDVGAITMLHAMADMGECRILATIASNKHPLVAATLSVLNTYFSRPGIPIGVVRGEAVNIGSSQKWDSLIVANYPHQVKSNNQAEDALNLYRRILSKQPDNSVTIVTVGFLTNMSNLLQSKADKYSALDGKALVAKKVKRLVCMAARFDDKMGSFTEFNVKEDATASKFAYDNWPTSILFSGFEIGLYIHTGLPIAHSHYTHSPVKDVFARSILMDKEDAKGRNSWDETALLVAVRGYNKYYTVASGKMICNTDGSNSWDKNGTRDLYLIQKTPVPEMENIINELIMHQPMKAKTGK